MTSPVPRPNPMQDAIRRVSPGLSAAVAVVSWLGSAGILNATQVAAVSSYAGDTAAATTPTGPIALVAGAVIGLLTGGGVHLGVKRAAKGATDDTTPVRSPQDIDGTPLVRKDGLPLGGVRVYPETPPGGVSTRFARDEPGQG
jgi:hypothetical protein